MAKIICFDMDGTIADLYGVDGWLAMLRAEDPTPYRVAAPLWDMCQLRGVLLDLMAQGWEVRVISWLAKGSTLGYKAQTRQAKLNWLAQYDFPYNKAHMVAYGATKADSVRDVADTAILVDDNAKVRAGWHLGPTIDPTKVDLIDALVALLEGGEP